MFADGEICGNEDQFHNGMDFPPEIPTPVYGNGVLPCCMGGLRLWFRPESLTTFNEFDFCGSWTDDSSFKEDFVSLSIPQQAVVSLWPNTEIRGLSFNRDRFLYSPIGGPTVGDFTSIVVGLDDGTFNIAGPIVGVAPVTGNAAPEVQASRIIFRQGPNNLIFNTPLTIGRHCWAIRRKGFIVEIWLDGILESSHTLPFAGPINLNRMGRAFVTTNPLAPFAGIFEWMLFSVALSDEDFDKTLTYLSDKFPEF